MSIDVASASGHVLDQNDTTAIQCFLSSLSNFQGMVQSSTSTGASDGNTSSGASDSSEVRPGESQSPAALMSSLTGLFASTSATSFPHELDYSQPAKSWWRYFQKQTVTNTAQCYSCGQVFNRGPKQSTTSLSHHLKMYHREMFIAIQQAKDDELRSNGKAPRAELQPLAERERRDSEELNESVLGKKTAFNMKLIGIVKEYPEIYDPKQRAAATEGDDRGRVWETVAQRLGESVTPELAKKRWLQIRDRYRKELKFAIRDNFSYTPKWPYFRDLTWLDEFLKDSCSVPIPRRPHLQRKRLAEDSSDANGSCFLDENSTELIASFINACNSPQVLELTAKHSPDSAIASTSDDGESTKEHNLTESAVKEENSPLNELDMTSTTTLLALQQFLASASESSAIATSTASSTLATTPKKARPASAVPAKAAATKSEPVDNGAKEAAASTNSFEYLKDEDSLFGRIVALRLKGFSIERKHLIKVAIEQLFEKHEREVLQDDR